MRNKLPNEREAITHRFVIGGEERGKGYITVGLYDDGSPGEIFVKMDRQGSQVSGFVDAWAIAVSMLLQRGEPLAEICNKFRGSRFTPEGITDNEHIRIVTSPIDYIVRWLEGKFVDTEMHEDEELIGEKKCARCGSSDKVYNHNGSPQCLKCRTGKA
jgi:ribonucleoside-diphosphate reductase alpha chain